MRLKINLTTESDVRKLIEVATKVTEDVWLTDSNYNLKVSGKSMLGALYAMSDWGWSDIYVESDKDLYFQLRDLIAE